MEKFELTVPGIDAVVSEIPNLLGFVPAESLVVIGIQDCGTREEVRYTSRIDLPAAADRAPAVQHLVQLAELKRVESVLAVVIGDRAQQ